MTDHSIKESFSLAGELGCENWKSRCSDELFNFTKSIWWQKIKEQDEVILLGIKLGKINDTIIEAFALDSFVVSTTPVVSKVELIKSLKEDLNQKIDSLRSL